MSVTLIDVLGRSHVFTTVLAIFHCSDEWTILKIRHLIIDSKKVFLTGSGHLRGLTAILMLPLVVFPPTGSIMFCQIQEETMA